MKNFNLRKYICTAGLTALATLGISVSAFAGSYTVGNQYIVLEIGKTADITLSAADAAGRFDWYSTGSVTGDGYVWLDNSSAIISIAAAKEGLGTVNIIPTDAAGYDSKKISGNSVVNIYAVAAGRSLTGSLKKGMTGTEVLILQYRLRQLGYLTAVPDGIFGNATYNAVRAYQTANSLYCDGIVGNQTLTSLKSSSAISKSSGSSDGSGSSTGTLVYKRTLSKGMTGSDVLAVQVRLYELGYLTVTPDGIFGNKTLAAVNEFQSANGLASPDGKVGKWTIGKLNGNPVSKSSSSYDGGNPAETISLSRTLSKGMTGSDVLAVQQKLQKLGYLTVTPDGIFGNKTLAAVNEFQAANGLANPDGKVGQWTVYMLNHNPVAKNNEISALIEESESIASLSMSADDPAMTASDTDTAIAEQANDADFEVSDNDLLDSADDAEIVSSESADDAEIVSSDSTDDAESVTAASENESEYEQAYSESTIEAGTSETESETAAESVDSENSIPVDDGIGTESGSTIIKPETAKLSDVENETESGPLNTEPETEAEPADSVCGTASE